MLSETTIAKKMLMYLLNDVLFAEKIVCLMLIGVDSVDPFRLGVDDDNDRAQHEAKELGGGVHGETVTIQNGSIVVFDLMQNFRL